MARPRKDAPKPDTQELALVPVEEQPYPLPEGWKWVRLGGIYQINPKSKAEDDTLASFVPMEKIDPGMKGTFTFDVQPWGKIKKGHTQFENGDIAFAKISPCFENGKSMLVQGLKNGLGAGTTELIVLRQPNIFQKYTFYLVSSSDFIQKGTQTYSGTVGQQRINMDFVRNYPIPLPPLDVQERIVTHIESLFAKLDEAKEKAQAALNSFETRKAAILHKAFTGELTAKWREAHGISLESWKYSLLGNYAESQYGYTESSTEEVVGPKFLRITDIQDGQVDWEKVPYCKIDIDKKAIYAIKKGDIVVARTGATTGKSYLIVDDVDAVYASYLIRISLNSNFISNQFLYAFMQSQEYWKQISEFSSGIAQPGVNGKKLRELALPIPSLSEQQEITRILDSLLEKEQQSKAAAEAVLEQIDLMKKAILAKAFRGELG